MRIILVEDNPQVRELLRTQLPVQYPGSEVVGEAEGIADGRVLLTQTPADLWLLDIELRDGNVFTLLDRLDPALVERTALIFLTAFNTAEYILEALRKSAVEYLSKPIDFDALRIALEKAQARLSQRDLPRQIADLRRLLQAGSAPAVPPPLEKIPVRAIGGIIHYLNLPDILYFKGEGGITHVCLVSSERPIKAGNTLKVFERQLQPEHAFFRLSKNYLVNLQHVTSLNAAEGYVCLTDGNKLLGSRDGIKALGNRFREMYGSDLA
ncbi:MAG: response regulator transcription factor [Saprospiraceae bacterium]|jgi:two-component system LytT family response regulator|nr:response regulator transcription factor [Saprospiraceae bacterium]